MVRVTLYSRPGCRLCEEARMELEAAAPDVSVAEVDIDADPVLRERYGTEIPVAVSEGRELFRHRFDPSCLARLRGA